MKKEKDFNKQLNNSKDMPKIVEIKDEEGIKKWGGRTMVIAPPLDYDKYMKVIPLGKIITLNEIRKKLALDYNVDITCPLTAGIFSNIVAHASFQRKEDITPFWRTLKSDGSLNEKYPQGIEYQKLMLEKEGFVIEERGKKNKKYFVKDYQNYIFEL
ncbi:MAG: MGMT family protein [Clostridia bacterium]|nr:MGMT family protein [Clostridia bacterium]